MSEFIIIVDSREKLPLNFSYYDCKTVSKKLDTGDYSIEGYEGIISCDRKKNCDELYNNFFLDYERFRRELGRFTLFSAAYIICEFPYYHLSSFPSYSKMPKKKIPYLRFTSQHLVDKVKHIEEKYGVKFIFCDGRMECEQRIFEILKEFWEKNNIL